MDNTHILIPLVELNGANFIPVPPTNTVDGVSSRRVDTIIFHGILRVVISPKYFGGDILNLVFPGNELPSTSISYDTLDSLLNTYHLGFDFTRWNEINSRHAELIKQAIIGFDKVIQDILTADILDLTYYFNYGLDLWDITQLCLKYNVEPVDIFIALVEDAEPFGMGAFSYPTTGKYNLAEKARDDFNQQLSNPNNSGAGDTHIRYDYWNGIGVKTSFPKDIHIHPMQMSIRRYNDRNDDLGYYRIIKLFANRVAASLDT